MWFKREDTLHLCTQRRHAVLEVCIQTQPHSSSQFANDMLVPRGEASSPYPCVCEAPCLSKKSTRSVISLGRVAWGLLVSGRITTGLTGFVSEGDAGGKSGTLQGRNSVPAGQLHGGTLRPFNDHICARGYGQIRSVMDGDPFQKGSLSKTSPPFPVCTCTRSSRTVLSICRARGSMW